MDFSKYTTEELNTLEKETIESHEETKKEILSLVDEIETRTKKINDLEIDLSLYEEVYKKIKEELNKR